jgi:hypothetical protein
MAKKAYRDQVLKEAWIGDAVLTLYARRRILREDGKVDGTKAERMTSNRFLSAFAEPSEAEAQIGRVYEQQGLDAAFEFIERKLMPLFEKQEARRTGNAGGSRAE